MVNKRLVDWIKSEETQGYTEAQLRKYLIQKGYNKKDVEEAIKLASRKKFSLINYVKSISIPIFIVFVLAFLFLYYSFNKFSEGLILLIILGILAFVTDFLYKKNKDTIAKWIPGLGLIVLLAFGFYFTTPLFVLIAVHSLLYFLKSKKKYSFESIFLILLISLTFSFAIAFLVYLIYAYGIFAIIGTIQSFILSLMMIPIYVIFIISYLLISINLIRKSFGEFNYAAYFRFKHFPFTILNILSSKEGNIKKSIIKLTTITFILLIIIILLITSFKGIRQIDDLHQRELAEYEKLSIEYPSDRYAKLAELKSYANEFKIHYIYWEDGRFVYSDRGLETAKKIYYNCDTDLNCQEKEFNIDQKLEEQVPLKDARAFATAKNELENVIFILPKESAEEIIFHNIFEFEDEELRDSQISLEFNNWRESIFRELLNKQATKRNWKEKLFHYYSGDHTYDTVDLILFIANLGADLYKIRVTKQISLQEYDWIKQNRINNTPFYDGSQTIQEHLQKLRNNVDYLYSKMPAATDKEPTYEMPDIFGEESLFDKAYARIYTRTHHYKSIETLGIGLQEVRENKLKTLIDLYYNKIDLPESDISKTIRLKILETAIAYQVIQHCKNKECVTEIISLTKNPMFCEQITSEFFDNFRSELTQCREDYSSNPGAS